MSDLDRLTDELAHHAAACDLGAWKECRLVYADCLEEQSEPLLAALAALARLEWEPDGWPSCAHTVTWRCTLSAPILPPVLHASSDHYKLLGCVNSRPFLHFARRTLRLADFALQGDTRLHGTPPGAGWLIRHLRWTHQPGGRARAGYYDVGAHLGGFAALLDPALTASTQEAR